MRAFSLSRRLRNPRRTGSLQKEMYDGESGRETGRSTRMSTLLNGTGNSLDATDQRRSWQALRVFLPELPQSARSLAPQGILDGLMALHQPPTIFEIVHWPGRPCHQAAPSWETCSLIGSRPARFASYAAGSRSVTRIRHCCLPGTCSDTGPLLRLPSRRKSTSQPYFEPSR